MRRLISILLIVIGTSTATLLVGCEAPPRLDEAARADPADCPDALRERVRVAASATAIALPDRMSSQVAAGRSEELLARRLLISAAPAPSATGTRVGWSAVTLTIVGGTYAGSVAARNRAVEVIPGRVRIDPFLSSSKLRAETIALDVVVVPGGVPADKMTVALPSLWMSDGKPVPPEALEMSVSAERHLTVFDVVEAHVSLDVEGAGAAGSHSVWKCTYETKFTLADHDSVLPALWDLHIASRDGKPRRWLALFNPSVGPFRAIFTDAQAAQAFTSWLRSTGATRVGQYQLGLFEADRDTDQSTIPADRDIGSNFRPASADDVQILIVGRLGEL